ncbi:MAG TPA: hypothetical protein EYN14_17405 [Alphaproteobacteria bacterium]|nr:hypothetical protein [Alphaproteobacteria bacterium]
MKMVLGMFVIVALVFRVDLTVEARVEGLEILERTPFAEGHQFGNSGAYERIRGRLHYAVDPYNAANGLIVDLALAPLDSQGMVPFSGDFMLLRPVEPKRGNQTLLYEVGNRGNVGMLSFFNDAPRTNQPISLADTGNGFLFREGYTLLWSAWNWDVTDGNHRMQIDLPVATDGGDPIINRIAVEITVNVPSRCEPFAWGNSRGYPPVPKFAESGTLSVRARQTDSRHLLPRNRWSFGCVPRGGEAPSSTHLYLVDGFEPGLLYELIYKTRDPRIVGLGLAAIRDTMSFFRFFETDSVGIPNPLWGATDNALVFGISQSGRVIQHMIYQALHIDEAQRMVFEGALVHVAGGGKGSFNHRFAQTTRHPSAHEDHQYPADFFPFATTLQTDPVTVEVGDVLARAKKNNAVPKIFYTNTSTEYWTRSASLLHTDTQGTVDVELDSRARSYLLAGTQHGVWAFAHRAFYENCLNPADQRPLMRALLGHLALWVGKGVLPPDNVYPRIDAGTLGTVAIWQNEFPQLPNLRLPDHNLAPPRLDHGPRWERGIVDYVPPKFGPSYVTLIPTPDADGVDRGGLRLPEIAAPLGTYLGWNLRRAKFGASKFIGRWSGSFVPFSVNELERIETGDPRVSLEGRYGDRSGYLEKVRDASRKLHARGFLLSEDLQRINKRAGQFYDRLIARDLTSDSCAYTVSHN